MASLPENSIYSDAAKTVPGASFSNLAKITQQLQQKTADSTASVFERGMNQFMNPGVAMDKELPILSPPTPIATQKPYSGGPLYPQEPGRTQALPEGYNQWDMHDAYGNPITTTPVDPYLKNWPLALGGGQTVEDRANPGKMIRSNAEIMDYKINPGARKLILGDLNPALYEVDHIQPRWAGGGDTLANLEALDLISHQKKTATQAVALTLLRNKKITEKEAFLMIQDWRDKDVRKLPTIEEINKEERDRKGNLIKPAGQMSLKIAEKLQKEWQNDLTKPVGILDHRILPYLGTAIKENAASLFSPKMLANLAGFFGIKTKDPSTLSDKGIPVLSEFGKGLVGSTGLMPGTEATQDPDKLMNASNQIANLAGNLVGMMTGMGLVGKGVAKVAGLGAAKFGKAKRLMDESAIAAGLMKKIDTGEKLASNITTATRLGEMAAAGGLFGLWGQITQTNRNLTGQEEATLKGHMTRFIEDAAFGAVTSGFGQSFKGYLGVGGSTTMMGILIPAIKGEEVDYGEALKQGALMTGLHLMGLKNTKFNAKGGYFPYKGQLEPIAKSQNIKQGSATLNQHAPEFPYVAVGEKTPEVWVPDYNKAKTDAVTIGGRYGITINPARLDTPQKVMKMYANAARNGVDVLFGGKPNMNRTELAQFKKTLSKEDAIEWKNERVRVATAEDMFNIYSEPLVSQPKKIQEWLKRVYDEAKLQQGGKTSKLPAFLKREKISPYKIIHDRMLKQVSSNRYENLPKVVKGLDEEGLKLLNKKIRNKTGNKNFLVQNMPATAIGKIKGSKDTYISPKAVETLTDYEGSKTEKGNGKKFLDKVVITNDVQDYGLSSALVQEGKIERPGNLLRKYLVEVVDGKPVLRDAGKVPMKDSYNVKEYPLNDPAVQQVNRLIKSIEKKSSNPQEVLDTLLADEKVGLKIGIEEAKKIYNKIKKNKTISVQDFYNIVEGKKGGLFEIFSSEGNTVNLSKQMRELNKSEVTIGDVEKAYGTKSEVPREDPTNPYLVTKLGKLGALQGEAITQMGRKLTEMQKTIKKIVQKEVAKEVPVTKKEPPAENPVKESVISTPPVTEKARVEEIKKLPEEVKVVAETPIIKQETNIKGETEINEEKALSDKIFAEFGKDKPISYVDILTETDKVNNAAIRSVEKKTKDMDPDAKETKALVKFSKAFTKENLDKRANDAYKEVGGDETKGSELFTKRISEAFKEKGLEDPTEGAENKQAYLKRFRDAIYDKDNLIFTFDEEGNPKHAWSTTKEPLSYAEEATGRRFMYYEENKNIDWWKKPKESDKKGFLLKKGFVPFYYDNKPGSLLGIEFDSSMAGGKKITDKGALDDFTLALAEKLGFKIDGTDTLNSFAKRLKSLNSREKINPIKGETWKHFVIKNDSGINKTIEETTPNWKDIKVSKVVKDAAKALKDLGKKKSIDGTQYTSQETIDRIAKGSGYIHSPDWVKPTQSFKSENGLFHQKLEMRAWSPAEKTNFEKELGRKLKPTDIVTFEDNVKVGYGKVGKDMGKYWEVDTPSESYRIKYNYPHETGGSISIGGILTKIPPEAGLGEIMGKHYKTFADNIKTLSAELQAPEGTPNIAEIWKKHPEFKKDRWMENLYGDLRKSVEHGAGLSQLGQTVNKEIDKIVNEIFLSGSFMKGDSLHIKPDTKVKLLNYKTGEMGYLNSGEVMISLKTFENLYGKKAYNELAQGKDFYVLGYRYPTLKDTSVAKMKILIAEWNGQKISDSQVIANSADTMRFDYDTDGDTLQLFAVGGKGIPTEVTNYFETKAKEGAMIFPDLEKAPKIPLVKNNLYDNYMKYSEQTLKGGEAIGISASVVRPLRFLKANDYKIEVSPATKDGNGKRTITHYLNGKIQNEIEVSERVKDSKTGEYLIRFKNSPKEKFEVDLNFGDKESYMIGQIGQEAVDSVGTVDLIKRFKNNNNDALSYIYENLYPKAKDPVILRSIDRFTKGYQTPYTLDQTVINPKTKEPIGTMKKLDPYIEEMEMIKSEGGKTGPVEEIVSNLKGLKEIDYSFRDSDAQKAKEALSRQEIKEKFPDVLENIKTGKVSPLFVSFKKKFLEIKGLKELTNTEKKKMIVTEWEKILEENDLNAKQKEEFSVWASYSDLANLSYYPDKPKWKKFVNRVTPIINASPRVARAHFAGENKWKQTSVIPAENRELAAIVKENTEKLKPVPENLKKAAIMFKEAQKGGYRERTIKNASSDATIALASDFNTAGEKLTKDSVESQKKQYIPIDAKNLKVTPERVNKIVESLNKVNAKTLNIAGNGMYTMKGYTQEQVDKFTYDLLKAVTESPKLKTKIEVIRNGGQTGFDEAGAKAGFKLRIPVEILAPKGWKYRDRFGIDISDKKGFMDRFSYKIDAATQKQNELDLHKTIKEPEYTPEKITSLKPNEIFVFGSNTEGRHGMGAAAIAKKTFGAKQGQAKGLQGKSYGIVTKDISNGAFSKLSRKEQLDTIGKQVYELIEFAQKNPDKKFLVTKIGTGLGGFKTEEIAKIWKDMADNGGLPKNIVLPKEFSPDYIPPTIIPNIGEKPKALKKEGVDINTLLSDKPAGGPTSGPWSGTNHFKMPKRPDGQGGIFDKLFNNTVTYNAADYQTPTPTPTLTPPIVKPVAPPILTPPKPIKTNPIGSAFKAVRNIVSPTPKVVTPTGYNVRGITVNDNDLQEAQRILFGEISNRPIKQQDEVRHAINTAINRALENPTRYGGSLTKVLQAPAQYQSYAPNGIKRKGKLIESEYQRLKRGVLNDSDKEKLETIMNVLNEMKTGKFGDTTGGKTFYVHASDGTMWLGKTQKEAKALANAHEKKIRGQVTKWNKSLGYPVLAMKD